METTLHVNDFKFHKAGKWRNNKNRLENWFVQNVKENIWRWIAFCCFAFITKLINLSSIPWKIHQLNIKTTTSKKRGDLLMKLYLFNLVFFQKTDRCFPLPQRFQKIFSHKIDIKKFLWISQTTKIAST